MSLNANYECAVIWAGAKIMADYYDPSDLTRPLGQVEVRLPDGGEPYIASEDNLGRNLLPSRFCDNEDSVSVVDIPSEIIGRLSDPRFIPILNQWGRQTLGEYAATPYECPLPNRNAAEKEEAQP